MKHCVPDSGKFAGILAIILLLAVNNDWATTHVVQFGGSLGFVFSPKDFSATVGDTVEWEGDFSVHPLSSTTIPANAPSWQIRRERRLCTLSRSPGITITNAMFTIVLVWSAPLR
jgi:plastocyanin